MYFPRKTQANHGDLKTPVPGPAAHLLAHPLNSEALGTVTQECEVHQICQGQVCCTLIRVPPVKALVLWIIQVPINQVQDLTHHGQALGIQELDPGIHVSVVPHVIQEEEVHKVHLLTLMKDLVFKMGFTEMVQHVEMDPQDNEMDHQDNEMDRQDLTISEMDR